MDSWDWVRWCHKSEPEALRQASLDALVAQSRTSKFQNPLIVSHKQAGVGLAAGYLMMYPGALGVIGNLRIESSDSYLMDSIENEIEQQKLLISVTNELCDQAFRLGAEIVQAVVPMPAGDLSGGVHANWNQVAFVGSVLKPLARLIQMRCDDVINVSLDSSSLNRVTFIPHTELDLKTWTTLVDTTYEETLDVPELNGIRSIENTLAGYLAGIEGVPRTWWAIREHGVYVGCLILTPLEHTSCELTYLGIVPQRRREGLGQLSMKFVQTWMLMHQVNRIVLAVDDRNLPAIRLYERCGMSRVQSLMVWIASAKSHNDS